MQVHSDQPCIPVAQFEQLRLLAWDLDAATVLTGTEALNLYERNWRHVDVAGIKTKERALIDQLVQVVGNGVLLV